MPGGSKSNHKGLGKGFDALLPRDFDTTILLDPSDRVQKIKISLISPKADQPRRHFEEESLKQLADSIKQFGVLQPIILTTDGDKYIIIAGERRWRAAGMAKLDTIPAIVRSLKN